MRLALGLALGFAAGVLALGAYLYSTGKLQLATKVATETSAVSPAPAPAPIPSPAPPDTVMPGPMATALPPPPNPALTAAPPQPEAMKLTGALDMKPRNLSGGMGLPLPNLRRDAVQDTFDDTRGGGTKHEATDIMAPRGTPVAAVVEGNVVKLFNSKKGGITVYQFDNEQKYCYYYAHLDKYADGLKEGMLLRKGDTLGYVGSTGDAQPNNPHLHFAILELGPDKHWWEHTTAINPYPLLVHALTQ